jgi:hypothetical protein
MLQQITYKGEKYPLRVSYYAIKRFELETGKKLTQLDDDLANLEVLLWYSLEAGAKATNAVLHLTREDCEFILDESMNEFSNAIQDSFAPPSKDEGKSKKK